MNNLLMDPTNWSVRNIINFELIIAHKMSILADARQQSLLFFEREQDPDIELVVNDENHDDAYPLYTTYIQILNNGYATLEDQQPEPQLTSSSCHQFSTPQPIKSPSSWLLELKQHQSIYFKVCQFLFIEDLMQLQLINSRFLLKTKRISLRWAVYNSMDGPFWATVTNFPSLIRVHCQQYSALGVNYDQESQHSRDLDRTFLLQDTEIIENNKLKLDRVLRALTKNGLYFQGLNYIASAFLTEHPEQNSYWYTRYILYKAGYFQNNLDKLSDLLKVMENMMKYHLPRLLNHLECEDLTVEYFAAKWFIAMYSYDTSIWLMLKLWKLLVLSDQNIMVCFTISILRKLQPFLLELQEQDLNTLLKIKLKETINQLPQEQLLLDTIDLYVKEFADLKFGFDLGQLEQNVYKNQISLD